MIPEFIRPGAIVEWDTASGVAIAQVAAVGRFHVTLRSPDGVTDSLEESAYSTLAQQVRHLRASMREFIDKNPGYVPSMWD